MKNKKALKVLEPEYNDSIYKEMNNIFGKMADTELMKVFRDDYSTFSRYHEYYNEKTLPPQKLYAVAQVLLEKGYCPFFNHVKELQLHIE